MFKSTGYPLTTGTGLKAEHAACEALLQRLRLRLTTPSEKEGWHPKQKYTIRGIVATRDVVFLRRPVQENLIELDGLDEAQEEWWKLGYDKTASEPLQIEVSFLFGFLRHT